MTESSKGHILLAEDDEHIARLIVFKLERDGYKVTVAKHGLEAIDLLPLQAWSLIVLDVMMPVADGWKVLKHLRQTGEASVPVLMLTAKAHQSDLAEAAQLGATHFIKKPFDPAELSAWVKKLSRKSGDPA